MLFNQAFDQFMARSNAASRRVATLGSNGTSSYTAAVHFAKTYPSSILLFPTYEDAADAVRSAPRDSALVVANAYASINRFYISHALSPIGAFFKDTPAYVVAAFDDDALEIRARIDELAFRQQCFNVRDRQIDLHRFLPLGLKVSFDGFCVRVKLPDMAGQRVEWSARSGGCPVR